MRLLALLLLYLVAACTGVDGTTVEIDYAKVEERIKALLSPPIQEVSRQVFSPPPPIGVDSVAVRVLAALPAPTPVDVEAFVARVSSELPASLSSADGAAIVEVTLGNLPPNNVSNGYVSNGYLPVNGRMTPNP